MEKWKRYIKKNNLIILAIFISIFIVLISFYQYYRDYYSYGPYYNEIKEKCEKTKDELICKEFSTFESPKEKLKKLDALTLTYEIVAHHEFQNFPLIEPLIIIILTINNIHSEFSSGMIKNYLTRIHYKDYLKKILKKSLKPALFLPFLFLLTFILSCLITKFNFNMDAEVKGIAVYEPFKYDHFLLYGFVLCIIHFFLGIFYGNIGILFCKKSKSKFITILYAYITYFIFVIILYAGVYALIINKILGISIPHEYFNLLAYWNLDSNNHLIIPCFFSFLFCISSYIILWKSYQRKERVLIENEREIS